MAEQFLADVHLGKLARNLRMLGFDTVFDAGMTKPQLLRLAHETQRIALSRNHALAGNPFIRALHIQSEDPSAQLEQVVRQYNLAPHMRPFSRCMMCNEPLMPVAAAQVWHLLPENSRLHFQEFWQCSQCRRVYWKGSHYERMARLVGQLGQV